MFDETFRIFSEPPVSRMVYMKTAVIIFGVAAFIHFAGQWRTPPLFDGKISLVLCLILAVVMLYGLTRTPFTKSLAVDYEKSRIVVSYLTLTNSENQLEIPFVRLSTKTDESFGLRGYGKKWKISLLLDKSEVYSLTNSEEGFTEEQLTDFIERVKECVGKQ